VCKTGCEKIHHFQRRSDSPVGLSDGDWLIWSGSKLAVNEIIPGVYQIHVVAVR
jgi:hypothetical protein